MRLSQNFRFSRPSRGLWTELVITRLSYSEDGLHENVAVLADFWRGAEHHSEESHLPRILKLLPIEVLVLHTGVLIKILEMLAGGRQRAAAL